MPDNPVPHTQPKGEPPQRRDAAGDLTAPPGTVRPAPGVEDVLYRAAGFDDSVTPHNLRINLEEQRLYIEWRDGVQSVLLLGALRRACPCATCRTERDRQTGTLLPILSFDPQKALKVTGARLVGTYALQLTWSDGHDTGLFDFRLLRSLADRQPAAG